MEIKLQYSFCTNVRAFNLKFYVLGEKIKLQGAELSFLLCSVSDSKYQCFSNPYM